MTEHIVDNYVPNTDGRWVSESFARLNEIVHDYNPWLDVGFLPSELQKTPFLQEHCYLVFDRRVNSAVFYFKPSIPPEEILARIFKMDSSKRDVLADLEMEERAAELYRLKVKDDEIRERAELAGWIMNRSGNYPKFVPPGEDKVVKFDDKLNRI